MFPEPDIPASARIIFKFGPKAMGTGIINFSQVNTSIKLAEFKYPPTNNTIVFYLSKFVTLCICT